jgi:hypothetical protein
MAEEKTPPHSGASVFEERFTFPSKPAEGEEFKSFNWIDSSDTWIRKHIVIPYAPASNWPDIASERSIQTNVYLLGRSRPIQSYQMCPPRSNPALPVRDVFGCTRISLVT